MALFTITTDKYTLFNDVAVGQLSKDKIKEKEEELLSFTPCALVCF